jgi:hypothetical protein
VLLGEINHFLAGHCGRSESRSHKILILNIETIAD